MFNAGIFSLTLVAVCVFVPRPVVTNCWDTGCQLNTWATKGCEQYNRYETKRITCDGGHIYTCCDKQDNVDDNIISTDSLNKHGDLTWYKLGLTACGKVYTDEDKVAALAFGHFTTANPNQDPICGKKIKIRDPSSGKDVIVPIVDKCEACSMNDVDVSSSVFKQLKPLSVGRFKINWDFI